MISDQNAKRSNSDKVINFQRFRSVKSAPALRQAEAYWTALRDGNSIPRRTQIDPRGLENLLEYAFIIERIAPGIARFRLAGQHLTQLIGMEVRGMPMSALFTSRSRPNVGAALEQVFDTPSIVDLTLHSEDRFGGPTFSAQMILLPLMSDYGDVSRALGVMVSDATDVSDTIRFDVTGTNFRAVSHVEPSGIEPAATSVSKDNLSAKNSNSYGNGSEPKPNPGFNEPAEPMKGRIPYLRLVKTDSRTKQTHHK